MMLFQGVLYFFMQLWLKIIAFLSNVFFLPVYALLNTFIPDLDNYLDVVDGFITDYVIKGVAFVREVLFNITGYPRGLFNFLIYFLTIKLTLMIAKILLKAILSAYYFARGAK